MLWAPRATTWRCEDGEIDRLLAFLHSNVARTGRFQVVDIDSRKTAVLDLLENNDVDGRVSLTRSFATPTSTRLGTL